MRRVRLLIGRMLIMAVALGVTTAAVPAQSALIAGQVTKVDRSAGKITIKHGPIKKLGMDQGMTMVFKAQDPAMLAAVKAGDKIKFDADSVNGQFTVTKIEKAR
jgi:Cu(I)/Ag(I) efflux system periplasmic protein CusF